MSWIHWLVTSNCFVVVTLGTMWRFEFARCGWTCSEHSNRGLEEPVGLAYLDSEPPSDCGEFWIISHVNISFLFFLFSIIFKIKFFYHTLYHLFYHLFYHFVYMSFTSDIGFWWYNPSNLGFRMLFRCFWIFVGCFWIFVGLNTLILLILWPN